MTMPPSAQKSAALRSVMLDASGAALRFARMNWQAIAVIAALGAAASTAVSFVTLELGQSQALLNMALSIAATMVGAGVYTALIGKALPLPHEPARFLERTMRMWAAMAVILFFLFIVTFAFAMVCVIALAPLLKPYEGAIQAAGQDQAALMQVGARFAQDHLPVVAVLTLAFGAIILLLTSRFYIAGPATLDQRRILTFETWKWTRGAMFQIVGARLLVLGPAYVLAGALSLILARGLGFDALNGDQMQSIAEHSPALFAAFTLVSEFVTIFLYQSLEAGLASAFYRALKPNRPESVF